MSWQWDAPTGTYKNFALSKNIRREAMEDTVFMRFLRPEPGYGKNRGESITITRIRQLPLAGKVSEVERLPSGRPDIETKSVTPNLWGFKIPVTEVEKRLTHFNIMEPMQAALRDQMALTMDWMGATAFKATPVKFIPSTTGGSFDTDGTPTGTADANLSVADLRTIHDYMRQTLKIPKYRNGNYVGILSTRCARGIKNDSDYKDWQAPTTSSPFITGMLKDVEGFTLIETNHASALADLAGSSTVCGEAVFFGADPAFLATVMDPELRMGLPEELGTQQEVGWVAHLEAGLTWDTASTARVIEVTSG